MEHSAISRQTAVGMWCLALVWWAVCLWFFSRHNQFPIYYHPDEASKGAQIVSGDLNFHHPLLMLDSIRLCLWMGREPQTVENAVFAGRWVSAFFSATAVLALAALAWRRAGWAGAALAAVLLPMHPLIYELAHYCKEDPALLVGMSLTFLLLDVFLTKPTTTRALWLGKAAGLAVSGKYLGIVMLLISLPFVWWKARQEPRRMTRLIAVFAGGFLAVVLLINLPYLLQFSALQKGLGYEIHAASLGGAKGLSREVPHGKYLDVFLDNVGWPLWIGLGLFAICWWVAREERQPNDLLLLLFPAAYTFLLSFSPKTASRYFLAVAPFLILAGSLGIVWLGKLLAGRPSVLRRGIPLTLAGCAIFVQAALLRPSVQGFARPDSRQEMAGWMARNLPVNVHVVAETRIYLSKSPALTSALRDGWQLQEETFLPDSGTLENLRSQGIRYVAVIRTSFGGFLDEKRKPSKDQAVQHQRRALFYRTLFATGKLLKKTGGNDPAILNPEIRLYDLGGSL